MASGIYRPLIVGLLAVGVTFAVQAEDDEGGDPVATARPAQMAPLVAKSIIMDIRKAGDAYVAVGEKGHILRSTDGAKTWKQMPSPSRSMIASLYVQDDSNLWAVGADYSILHSSDAGKTWAVKHFNGIGKPLYDIYFFDNQHGIAVGSYGLYLETRDGGNTWTERTFGFSDTGLHLNSIARLGNGNIVISGERGQVILSADMGETWKVLDSPYIGSFFGILPYGAAGFVTYGLRGNTYVVDDVAMTKEVDQTTMADEWFMREIITDPAAVAALGWREITNPVTESLFGGRWQTPDQTLLAVGASGALIKIDVPAGKAERVESPTDEVLAQVIEVNGKIIVVGRRGIMTVGEDK